MTRIVMCIDCGAALTGKSPRCPEHRAARDRLRQKTWKANPENRARVYISKSNKRAEQLGQPRMDLGTPLPQGTCTYCGGPATGWDHVVALGRGGVHGVENLTPSCWPCNRNKRLIPAEAFMALPRVLNLLCAWCWAPITRRTAEVLKAERRGRKYFACSLSCRSYLLHKARLTLAETWRHVI